MAFIKEPKGKITVIPKVIYREWVGSTGCYDYAIGQSFWYFMQKND